MLEHLSSSPREPLLIVSSRNADERLWAEVLNLGGFDVIATPFDSFEVSFVAATAAATAELGYSRRERLTRAYCAGEK